VFDLRYHAVSLAAVFLFFVIGILVGVGISGRGVLGESERLGLEAQIEQAERARDVAERRVAGQAALEEYARETYPAVMEGRLAERRIGVLYLGSAEGEVAGEVQETIDRADGELTRTRALRLPIVTGELLRTVSDVPDAPNTVEDLGRGLAAELVDGGDTPLWDAVGPVLVEEREGASGRPIDAVVIARTVEPQGGQSARFLAGFYAGLAGSGVPVVGVETTDADPSAITTYRDHGFSTVDHLDTEAGKVALAVLLEEDGPRGAFGTKDEDIPVLPAVFPVVPPVE
jgi:Copper transport outer membrane protein, MctB